MMLWFGSDEFESPQFEPQFSELFSQNLYWISPEPLKGMSISHFTASVLSSVFFIKSPPQSLKLPLMYISSGIKTLSGILSRDV